MRRIIVLAAAVITLSACTPEQMQLWLQTSEPHAQVVTADQLERLRHCESTGNYEAVSRSGTYRGAYQFNQSTWNGVAQRHFPWLEHLDPATVEPAWQDSMARALYAERGASPWPHCGRRM
jgi:muramidase (phage lysozyme)